MANSAQSRLDLSLEPDATEAPLDTTLAIETPEHIAFRYQLAGPARRAAAYFVDLVVRALIVLLFAIVLAFSSIAWSDATGGFEVGAMLLVFFLLEWGYFVVFEAMGGASPGKRAFRLRVIHQNGRPISFGEAVLRNLLRAADLLPFLYAIGLVAMALDERFRRLGDLVAGTVVVHEPRTTLDARDTAARGLEVDGLPARPHLSTEERSALALFHRRRPSLSHARALELADMVAPIFRERFGLPNAPAIELLEVLYRKAEVR